MTTKTVVPIPTGDNNIRILNAGEIYCSNCDESFDSDDWSETDVFEPESLAQWITGHEIFIETESEDSIWTWFGHEGIKTLVKKECPNGCTYYGGDGEAWWFISDTQYVCSEDDEWFDSPHNALLCCANCIDNGTKETCHCINMVQTDSQGRPELIAGQPLSRCLCGGAECDQIVCLLCHWHWDDGSVDVNFHMEQQHPGEEWELAEPALYTYAPTPTKAEVDAFRQVLLDANTMTTTQPSTKCEICGAYCCAIHKTHATPHQFCWEGK